MSDLDIVIKALRDTADDLYRYNDSLKDAGADALEALARNLKEAVERQHASIGAPLIIGFSPRDRYEDDADEGHEDPEEDTEDHCRLHCGCNGLNWGH